MKISLISLSLTLLFSCAQEPSASEGKEEQSEKVEGKDYIGMKMEDAIALAKEKKDLFRVVMMDGKHLPRTKDLRPGRINATVEKGIIVSYKVE